MSKYEELWTIYQEENKKRKEYKNACINFADELYGRFIDYIGCPKERIRFYPFNRESTGESTPRHAASEGEDGRVETCAMLKFGPPPGTKATKEDRLPPINVPTAFGRQGDKFTVQVGQGKIFVLTSADDPDAQSFFDDVVDQIADYLRHSSTAESGRLRIGFRLPEGD